MKIQHLAIIFIIIILPISMVISYYVNAQIKTIQQQELYDSKLVTATYDSVRSFQLNTINNMYSSVSDSKIRDIEAGISSFFNSLGTELGATGYSREDLSSFIPAILYTMYDGYYIYGKYYDEGLEITDENGDVIDYGDYRIGLKPYVYYACRYKDSRNDFVVNYTLDNTITVYGKVNGNDVAYSGALIKIGDIDRNSIDKLTYTYVTSTNNTITKTVATGIKYKEVEIKPEVLSEKLFIYDDFGTPVLDDYGKPKIYEYVTYNDQKIYVEKDEDGNVATYNNGEYTYRKGDGTTYNGIKCFWNYKNKKQYITDIETMAFVKAMTYADVEGGPTHLHSNSACQYYYDAYQFSTWVKDNLSGIEQRHAVDENRETITDFETNTGSDDIFDVEKEDPTLESSTFNQQRINVIKKSIKSSLTSEMANYGANTGYDYRMPQFTAEDWDKIVNNIAVTTFMQGMSIGMKYYNNYCVITNDKNKEVVTEDSIYIIDENSEAHYPACNELVDGSINAVSGYRNIDFERQTVVSSGDNYYFYPHDNQKSYNCMVNAKGTYDLEEVIQGKVYDYDGDRKSDTSKNVNPNLRKIYLTALAREKYDLYRTNGYFGVPIE